MTDARAFICGCHGFSLTSDERAFLAEAAPWGLILFKRNVESPGQLAELTAEFRSIVARSNAPVLIDQEGGRVQRMGPPVWRKYPAGSAYARAFERNPEVALDQTRQIHRLMAVDLIAAGITVDCLPVLDVPQPGSHDVIGDRAYGTDPNQIAALGRAAAEGLMDGGVLPVIKHIPGHGRAMADSHKSLPTVDTPLDQLSSIDFAPFGSLAEMPMAMTAHVVYSAIDPVQPATLSDKIMSGIVRDAIGFEGLVMTDDLTMQALSGSLGERSNAALAAGCDMLLHCNGDLDQMREVARAAPVLSGPALDRADRALAMMRPPVTFDEDEAITALDDVLTD